jgi:hypothetical protein
MIKPRSAYRSSCHPAAYALALVEDEGLASGLLQGSCSGKPRHTRTNHEHICVPVDDVLHLR